MVGHGKVTGSQGKGRVPKVVFPKTVFPRAPSGSLFKEKFLINPQSKVDLGPDDSVPKSKRGPGSSHSIWSCCSPGSNFGSGSVSGANAPTDILASEMQRDPAFALWNGA